ncbi:hypothetical protein OpiT1DRAFT_03179 [Opitutaceae bacterium TAV1]|nr:hypothetical protein OpiT1DRAFT_03179 [Opitutaceae bacterium TAV1]
MKRLLPLLIACFLPVLAARAQTTLFQTDFTGENGTTPASFVLKNGTVANLFIQNNEYRAVSGTANLLSVYEPDAGAYELTDYTVSAHFRIGDYRAGAYAGLVARFTSTVNFYQARLFISDTSGNSTLQIYKTVGGATTLLAESGSFVYDKATTWELVFTVDGDSLSATLHNQSDSVVTSLLATDTSLTQGTAGVRTTPPSGSAVVYENFAITTAAIPEPASVAVAIGALGLVAAFALRRRQAAGRV